MFSNIPQQIYVDHCIYTLLQNFLCYADVSILAYNKLRGYTGSIIDLNTDNKCRDAQSVFDWGLANQVNAMREQWEEPLIPPKGIKGLSAEVYPPPRSHNI